jgi:hypothetical protein
MKDEKLYIWFGPIRSGFLATLIFNSKSSNNYKRFEKDLKEWLHGGRI